MANLNSYITRYNELKKKTENLDQELNEFLCDLRGQFPAGKVGDNKFQSFCMVELEVKAIVAREYLVRASLGAVFSTSAEIRAVGGYSAAVYYLGDLPSSKQRDALTKAKDRKVTIRSLFPASEKSETPKHNGKSDLKMLAEYALSVKTCPSEIKAIASKYASLNLPGRIEVRRSVRTHA